MNYRKRIIFLWSLICCTTAMGAVRCQYPFKRVYVPYGNITRTLDKEEKKYTYCCDIVRKKIKQAYLISRKKTRMIYQAAQEYKKVIASMVAYVAFEGIAYSSGWDSPLRRLLTPRRRFEYDKEMGHEYQKEIAHLTDCFQELQLRYEELHKKLEEERALTDFKLQQHSLMKEFEKFMED